jgi:hypothetical protein
VEVFLTCYRVLQAAGDSRAAQVLAQGRTVLRTRLESLPDAADRRAMAENISAHREIQAAGP